MSTLSAEDLGKTYRGRRVVHGVNISVDQGEVVGLLGPNGAGKTTSFYMIVGLVPADGGVITWNGNGITKLPVHARARQGLGYLPQEASVFRKLTVEDNILAILETRDDLKRKDRKQRLEELLEELHISHIRDGLGISLS